MKTRGILLVLTMVVQIVVPAWIAYSSQSILNHGAVYKFQTRPIDPYDVFRGHFVAVGTDQDRVEYPTKDHPYFFEGQRVYALLEEGENGFAKIAGLKVKKPRSGDFIKSTVDYIETVQVKKTEAEDLVDPSATESATKRKWKRVPVYVVHINLPFDRFYMNESKAERAERKVREYSRQGKADAHLVVRVLDGKALIDDLVVGGSGINSYFD